MNLDEIQWVHGAPNCALSTAAPLQVVQADEDTFVIRVDKCVHFEAPFLYLLFGEDTVLLHDTGPIPSATQLSLRPTVEEIIERRLAARRQASIQRRISHSHGHGDHVAGDAQFANHAEWQIAPTGVAGVRTFHGISSWPDGFGALDLGGRRLTVLPTPGHADDHIMLFDPDRGLLLTGDMLYPGLLTVRDWANYRASAQRLGAFCRTVEQEGTPVKLALGAHIEMSSTAGEIYPIGSTFQPQEHRLPLTTAHIFQLEAALAGAQTPTIIPRDSFIVSPLD